MVVTEIEMHYCLHPNQFKIYKFRTGYILDNLSVHPKTNMSIIRPSYNTAPKWPTTVVINLATSTSFRYALRGKDTSPFWAILAWKCDWDERFPTHYQ